MTMNLGPHDGEYTAEDGSLGPVDDSRYVDGGFSDPEGEATSSPLDVVLTRMHGRWIQAIVLAAILAPIFGVAGFLLGPVEYTSSAQLQVIRSVDPLVEKTIETENIDATSVRADQATLIGSNQVAARAIGKLAERWESEEPSFRESVANEITVRMPRSSTLLLIQMEHPNRGFAAAAVNAVANAFLELHAPDSEVVFQQKVEKIQGRIEASRMRIRELSRQKNEILKDNEYQITSPGMIMDRRFEQLRRLDAQIEDAESDAERVRDSVVAAARKRAEEEEREPTEEEMTPKDDDLLVPSDKELESIDPELTGMESSLDDLRLQFSLIQNRFGPRHEQYRRFEATVIAREKNYEKRVQAAREAWMAGPGQDHSWGSIQRRIGELRSDRTEIVDKMKSLDDAIIKSDEISTKIIGEQAELKKLGDRWQDLDREREGIRKGRVEFLSEGMPGVIPSKDKRLQAAMFGSVAGFGAAFALFFLVGTLDQKTYAVSQLERGGGSSLKVLGVLPNMDEVTEDAEAVTLATDCIHRLRGRIEARRAPERGYALMVSSPFQGDGKTTLAVSLGWSYAESGYKTLLLDADFIGRAMTHQFGRLRDAGLREIIKNGRVQDEIVSLGEENLSLLGVGFDRRISAANLSPRLMARVLESVRDEYDIIIIDSGPITASIEAMPVASSSDGAVLALRRGRSRSRLPECIADLRSVGTDYLGVVFNYAEKSDCMRYGSTSKMSTAVKAALEGEDTTALPSARNPLLGDMNDEG